MQLRKMSNSVGKDGWEAKFGHYQYNLTIDLCSGCKPRITITLWKVNHNDLSVPSTVLKANN